jgi:hypothetical protein
MKTDFHTIGTWHDNCFCFRYGCFEEIGKTSTVYSPQLACFDRVCNDVNHSRCISPESSAGVSEDNLRIPMEIK